jgi:hypothetical protein
VVFSLVSLVVGVGFSQAAIPVRPRIEEALMGSWVGTLEYRDYSDNSRQRLGTLLTVSRDKATGRLVCRYVYDDGPNKVVQESEQVEIDWAGAKYRVFGSEGKPPTEYSVEGLAKLSTAGYGRLRLSGKATENDKPVDIRETVTLSADRFTMLRESKLPGADYLFRHQFTFVRVKSFK